jgi:hypothetical protein
LARFEPDDALDVDAVLTIPALFMAETRSEGEQPARVGTITRVHQVGTEFQLEYSYDPLIPPVSNERLAELATELEIGDWEFTRTHWAIKDVDLFYVLLRSGVARAPAPKVFQLSGEPVDRKLVSVMMPFDASFDGVYAALDQAVHGLRKRCRRADDIWNHDAVIEDIVYLIGTSSVVICDLSGKNPNVFYEAGIAHTLGKDVILITQSADNVPFNLRHLRFVQYHNNGEGRARLAEQVVDRIKTLSGA